MHATDLPPLALTARPRRALCVAVDEDALAGYDRALAFLRERAERVDVVLATGTGAAHAQRLGLAAGALASDETLVARLRQVVDEIAPDLITVSAPSPGSDRTALPLALASAITSGPERPVLVLGAGHRATNVLDDPTRERVLLTMSREALAAIRPPVAAGVPRTTAVVSTWNKKEDVRANLDALRAQTLPFAAIVVVDNASRDGTAAAIAAEYPEVRLITMPHERFGACTTFNLGFQAVTTELTAILDDDIVMPPDWLEKATARIVREPATTAIVSTQVIEPGMPASYRDSPAVNQERYMSTFRGCASLARTDALRRAGWYDERLWIYGNERDLTCRLLNLGFRVLQYPDAHVFHKTPFGIKMGKRSLYYHARNAWLSTLKYAPARDLARMPWLALKVLLRGEREEARGTVTDATGTIGIGRSVRETPGAWWVLAKAGLSVLANVPYCLRHRQPCRAPDFELPLS